LESGLHTASRNAQSMKGGIVFHKSHRTRSVAIVSGHERNRFSRAHLI
jgi:hypothetical protein